jgi:hypothetical protein
MEFIVDNLSLIGPGGNFAVDNLAKDAVLIPQVRKVIVVDNEYYCYSQDLWKIPETTELKHRNTGKTFRLNAEELEWIENVKLFLKKFQFIIEQDLSE